MSSNYRKSYLIACGLLAWLTGACENPKYTQCQEIIAIASSANQQAQQITNTSSQKISEMKSWLQASNIMERAAREIEEVALKDPELIDYQANLAKVFQVYSQAIYDAVQARETKNITALKSARNSAQEVWQLNQTLVADINSYCTKN